LDHKNISNINNYEEMQKLTERELLDFQTSYPWFTGTRLPDGRILGKHDRIKESTDPIFKIVKENLDLSSDKTMIEFGCAEGTLSVYLAPLVKKLTTVEVRPRNISALLTRLFVHDIHNVEAQLKDVSIIDDSWGKYDILFHAGVLYHLSNPVTHIYSLQGMAAQLLLDTHYASDKLNFPKIIITHNSKNYEAFSFKEQGWSDPYSGIDPTSCWLKKEMIIQLLTEIGYKQIEVKRDYEVFGMPRFTVVAKK
jgi:hypothetical protein